MPDSSYFFDFHEVCDVHDLCYIERPYGSSDEARAQCDDEFYDDMVAACQDQWPRRRHVFQRGVCYGVAFTYYVGVRLFGGFGWDDGVDADVAEVA